jgi:hypothetical protein
VRLLRKIRTNPFAARGTQASCAAAALILLTVAPADASAILTVAGSTAGCFGENCDDFSASATSDSDYALTFNGSTFTATTDATGSAFDFVIGTISRENVRTPEDTDPLPFILQVTFTLPTGINGGQDEPFTALIKGTSASGGGGPLPVDFDNDWIYFQFTNALGTGSFEFRVSDPSLNKNNDDPILASVRNATFAPTSPQGEEEAENVPEPSALLMLGTAALLFGRRRLRR